MKNKFLVIIQARLGSTRFPGKNFKKLGKTTLIEIIFEKVV